MQVEQSLIKEICNISSRLYKWFKSSKLHLKFKIAILIVIVIIGLPACIAIFVYQNHDLSSYIDRHTQSYYLKQAILHGSTYLIDQNITYQIIGNTNLELETVISKALQDNPTLKAISMTTCECPATAWRISNSPLRNNKLFSGMQQQRKDDLILRHKIITDMAVKYPTRVQFYILYSKKECINYDVFRENVNTYSSIHPRLTRQTVFPCGLHWILIHNNIYYVYGEKAPFQADKEVQCYVDVKDEYIYFYRIGDINRFKKTRYGKFFDILNINYKL